MVEVAGGIFPPALKIFSGKFCGLVDFQLEPGGVVLGLACCRGVSLPWGLVGAAGGSAGRVAGRPVRVDEQRRRVTG
jgi:hypothetical protein